MLRLFLLTQIANGLWPVKTPFTLCGSERTNVHSPCGDEHVDGLQSYFPQRGSRRRRQYRSPLAGAARLAGARRMVNSLPADLTPNRLMVEDHATAA